MSAHTHCPHTHLCACAWTHSHSKRKQCQNKGTAANALVQSCKHRLAHYKQVCVPCHSAGLALSLGHTHTQQEGEFVPVPSSLVYFWGDEKNDQSYVTRLQEWPSDCLRCLLLHTHKYTHLHLHSQTLAHTSPPPHTHTQNFCLWLNTLTIMSWHSQKWIYNISALYFSHIGVCTPRPSSKPSPCLGV